MKDHSNIGPEEDEIDFENLSKDMDIIFGNIFSARAIVATHSDSNFVSYSDNYAQPLFLENVEDVQLLNQEMRYPFTETPADKIQH